MKSFLIVAALAWAPGALAVTPLNGCGKDAELKQADVDKDLGDGFGKVIQTCKLVPDVADGALRGFKVFGIEKGSLLERAGFKNGDVVTKVNGAALDSPVKGFALFEGFKAPGPLETVLYRGSASCVLHVKK